MMFNFALPYRKRAITECCQLGQARPVSFPICREFRFPESSVSLRDTEMNTFLVSVPIAAVDEYRPAATLVGEIRGAGQRPDIEAVGLSEATQRTPDHLLGRRVLLTHARHQRASLRVGHRPTRRIRELLCGQTHVRRWQAPCRVLRSAFHPLQMRTETTSETIDEAEPATFHSLHEAPCRTCRE